MKLNQGEENEFHVEFTKLGLEDLFFGTGVQVVTRFGEEFTIHEINAANLPFDASHTLQEILDIRYPAIASINNQIMVIRDLHNALPLVQKVEADIRAWHALGAIATVGNKTSVLFDPQTNLFTFTIERGPRGSTGPQGADGAPGQGLQVLGARPDETTLPTNGNSPGDAYLLTDTGELAVYNNSGTWTKLANLQGPIGPEGHQGPVGPQGNQGNVGVQGASGKSAYEEWLAQGYTGTYPDYLASLEGPQGVNGPAGAKGDPGPRGPQGIPGQRGIQGHIGIDGLRGPAGPVSTGIHILSAVPTKADLPQTGNAHGDAHLATDTGNLHVYDTNGVWTALGHIRGPMGVQGATGPHGPHGPDGPQGIQGIQGPEGHKGAKGDPGLKGDKGDQGNIGPEGPKGLKGDKGNPGNAGPKGADGPVGKAGTGVSIKGTSSKASILAKTGAAGDMWLIADTGTDHGHGLVSDGNGTGAAHWTDVGAIQGPTGSKGDQGVKGADGPAGPQGPKGDKGDTGHVGSIGHKGDPGAEGQKGNTGGTGHIGPQGHTGPQGPTGRRGQKGERGVGIEFLSAKASVDEIRTIVNPNIGDIHLAIDSGRLWIYDSPVPPHDPGLADWHDVGHVQGPEGPMGHPGPAGPQGDHGKSTIMVATQADIDAHPQAGSLVAIADFGIYMKGDVLVKDHQGAWYVHGTLLGPRGLRGHNGHAGAPGGVGPQGPRGAKGATGSEGPHGPAGARGPAGNVTFATDAEILAGMVTNKAISPKGMNAAKQAFLHGMITSTDWATKTEGGIIKIALENGVLSITNDGTDA